MNNSEVVNKLLNIEHTTGIEILLAVEAGSRAWGFPSPDSDYDVRFIYKRPLSWYLSIHERRDVIELQENPPLDINGWDIKKCLFQIERGNPAFIEWLESPIVYDCNIYVVSKLKELAKHYFNPRTAIYHYLHMASGNYREYLHTDIVRLKKYVYVLRPLIACHYIFQQHKMPPVNYLELINDTKLDEFPINEVNELLELKMKNPEIQTGPRRQRINNWIDKNLEKFAEIARTTQKVNNKADDLDEYFKNLVTQ